MLSGRRRPVVAEFGAAEHGGSLERDHGSSSTSIRPSRTAAFISS